MPDVFTVFLNKDDDDDDDDDDVIGSTFVGSTQTFFYRAACVIGLVSSLGYLDAPAVLPTPPHLRSLPVSMTEKNIFLVSTFQLFTVHKNRTWFNWRCSKDYVFR